MAEGSPHGFLNALSREDAERALAACCGSSRWVVSMLDARPFASDEALFAHAEAAWARLERRDFLEAFTHHPRIGDDLEKLRERFAGTAELAAGEQARVADADRATLEALRDGNRAYEARFGFIFVVCATGKSAREMLDLLSARLTNDAERELTLAAAEQAKITRLRLAKLVR